MNNNAEDYAQANGRRLGEVLHTAGAQIVAALSAQLTVGESLLDLC